MWEEIVYSRSENEIVFINPSATPGDKGLWRRVVPLPIEGIESYVWGVPFAVYLLVYNKALVEKCLVSNGDELSAYRRREQGYIEDCEIRTERRVP
jgi:hypothetical protein